MNLKFLKIFTFIFVIFFSWSSYAQTLVYKVMRNGDQIGSHSFQIQKNGNTVQVSVSTNIKVKVAFITAYRYTHSRQETWQNGMLKSLSSVTHDDGKDLSLTVTSKDSQLNLSSGQSNRSVNGNLETVVSLWNKDILSKRKLFSALDGSSYNVSIREVGKEVINVGGNSVEAIHYNMSGDLNRELWYSPSGKFLKTSFIRKGSNISWELQ